MSDSAGGAPAPEHGVIPGGYVDIVFNLGGSVYTSDSDDLFIAAAKGFVVGPLDRFQRFRVAGRLQFFGVRLHPGRDCFISADLALGETRNRAIPLDSVWGGKGAGAEVRFLEQRLVRLSETASRLALIEQFLMQRRQRFHWPDRLLMRAVDAIEAARGQVSIEELATALRVSSRQLERKFIRHVGLTPKAFCRVTRFRQAQCLLEGVGESSGCDLAYACGYYDQAHLIREFRLFTGHTPTRYESAQPVGFFLYGLKK